ETADNSYRGYRLALWIFGLVVAMKTGIALNAIFNGHFVAISADGIPLDSLVRYRTLIPFMYVLLLLEHLGRRLFLTVMPIPRVGAPPGGFVNLLLLSLMVIGLVLSLRRRTSTTP